MRGGVTCKNGDPGYRQTSIFIAETAVSLALGECRSRCGCRCVGVGVGGSLSVSVICYVGFMDLPPFSFA